MSDGAKFNCPFCGLDVHAGTARELNVKGIGSETCVVIHLRGDTTEPMCEKFDDMEPTEFLAACRKILVGEIQ